MDREACVLWFMGYQRVGYDWVTDLIWSLGWNHSGKYDINLNLPGATSWRRQWQPTPVLLPRKSHGRRSLAQPTVHGVAKSRTPLSDFTFTFKWYYKIIFPKSYLPLTLWKITPFIPKMKFLFKNSENLSSWLVFCLLIIRLFKIQVLRGLLMHAD